MTILSLLHPSITWEKYFILSNVAKEIFKKSKYIQELQISSKEIKLCERFTGTENFK